MTPVYLQIYRNNPQKLVASYKKLGHDNFKKFLADSLMLVQDFSKHSARIIAGKLAMFIQDTLLLEELES